MARVRGNTFFIDMHVYKRNRIGCYNRGLMSGRTNMVNQWEIPLEQEPKVWFDDILRKDGTPLDVKAVEFIKSLTRDLP